MGLYMLCPRCLDKLRRGKFMYDPFGRVFNSGFMLMDLDEYRRQGLKDNITDWVEVTQGYEGDQSAFNLVFNGIEGIHLLDWRWNFQPHMYHEIGVIPVPE